MQHSNFKHIIFHALIFLLGVLAFGASASAAYNPNADINPNACVNSGDLTTLRSNFRSTNPSAGDINNDGKVTVMDLAYIMNSWNQCSSLGAGTTSFSIQSGGSTRTFTVHVPASYQVGTAVPVVLNFHGGSGDGPGQERISQMDSNADQHGYIVVYPDGSPLIAGSTNSIYFWNPGVGDDGYMYPYPVWDSIDDVRFVNDMLDDIRHKYTLNAKKTYATGLSNGGIFSQKLGCSLANRIAAIAPVESWMWTKTVDCNPSRPVPTLMFRGTSDTWVPYSGGVGACVTDIPRNTKSADADFTVWKTKDSCTAAFETVNLTNSSQSDPTSISCEFHSQCSSGAGVSLCTVNGGGHTWPGGRAYISPIQTPECQPGNISSVDGNEVIWQFFSGYQLP